MDFGRLNRSLLDCLNSFHGCYLRVFFRKDSDPPVKNRVGDRENIADMGSTHPLFKVKPHRLAVVLLALSRIIE